MYNYMEKINTIVKKWGNSYGIILPKELVQSQELKEGARIDIIVQPRKKTKVKDIFGILKGKLKKDTDQIMDEVDKELWGIEK
jgi:antitoxin component of MazEF toxin-antitoxin module